MTKSLDCWPPHEHEIARRDVHVDAIMCPLKELSIKFWVFYSLQSETWWSSQASRHSGLFFCECPPNKRRNLHKFLSVSLKQIARRGMSARVLLATANSQTGFEDRRNLLHTMQTSWFATAARWKRDANQLTNVFDCLSLTTDCSLLPVRSL